MYNCSMIAYSLFDIPMLASTATALEMTPCTRAPNQFKDCFQQKRPWHQLCVVSTTNPALWYPHTLDSDLRTIPAASCFGTTHTLSPYSLCTASTVLLCRTAGAVTPRYRNESAAIPPAYTFPTCATYAKSHTSSYINGSVCTPSVGHHRESSHVTHLAFSSRLGLLTFDHGN